MGSPVARSRAHPRKAAAEPDKTYYFRARITYSAVRRGAANMNLDLDRIDPDEGQFLVSSYRLSVSHPKK